MTASPCAESGYVTTQRMNAIFVKKRPPQVARFNSAAVRPVNLDGRDWLNTDGC